MNDLQRILAWGAIISASLYLVMVYYTAILTQNRWGAYLAIAAMGITYLAYSVGFAAYGYQSPSRIIGIAHNILAPLSVLVGLAAGIALIWR